MITFFDAQLNLQKVIDFVGDISGGGIAVPGYGSGYAIHQYYPVAREDGLIVALVELLGDELLLATFLIDPFTESFSFVPGSIAENPNMYEVANSLTRWRGQTYQWDEPAVTLPAYPIAQLLEARETEIDIAWTFTDTPLISGFNVYVNNIKQNNQPLSVEDAEGYTLTDLTGGQKYSINLTSLFENGDESILGNVLLTETTAPEAPPAAEGPEEFETYAVDSTPAKFSVIAAPSHISWLITDARSFNGAKSLASGVITDNETSSFIYYAELVQQSTLTFQYLASTEGGYDFFYVYINGIQELASSGQSNWIAFEKTLAAGRHALRFEFVKDGSVSGGDDRVYIDDLMFEPAAIDLPANPTSLEAVLQDTTYNLTWDANTEPDLAGYNIYVDGAKFNPDIIANNAAQLDGIDTGITHTFEITAVNNNGYESGKSNSLELRPELSANPPQGYTKAFEVSGPNDGSDVHSYGFNSWQMFLEFSTQDVISTEEEFSNSDTEMINLYIITDTGLELQLDADPDGDDPYTDLYHAPADGYFDVTVNNYIPETETRPYFPKLQELAEQTADGTIGYLEIWVQKIAATTITPY